MHGRPEIIENHLDHYIYIETIRIIGTTPVANYVKQGCERR